mmetsp:Transcript_100770/g.325243  ORF Transcript_100770/g.325243 Transcript_100770/m.325243 type:complete len:207 (-) Transcript_100770:774-1394(-)
MDDLDARPGLRLLRALPRGAAELQAELRHVRGVRLQDRRGVRGLPGDEEQVLRQPGGAGPRDAAGEAPRAVAGVGQDRRRRVDAGPHARAVPRLRPGQPQGEPARGDEDRRGRLHAARLPGQGLRLHRGDHRRHAREGVPDRPWRRAERVVEFKHHQLLQDALGHERRRPAARLCGRRHPGAAALPIGAWHQCRLAGYDALLLERA